MDHDFVELQVSGADLVQRLPSYDDRRAIVAQDGLASVEGFRLTVLLTCEYIFGLRMCENFMKLCLGVNLAGVNLLFAAR